MSPPVDYCCMAVHGGAAPTPSKSALPERRPLCPLSMMRSPLNLMGSGPSGTPPPRAKVRPWLTPSRYATYQGDAYEVHKVLGSGAFGLVSLVTKPHDDKQLFAMKTIDRFRLHNAMLRKSVANEISVLRRLSDDDTRHSGIAALVEVIETPRSIHLVIEFGGPSCHELLMRDGPLAEADARSVGGQIADALAHCHALAVCHRDVKLENIVVHERHAKLIDFGLSCVWHEGMVPLRRLAGSLPYMPPEMAHLVAGRKRPPLRAREEQPDTATGYNPSAVDVWSLGASIARMLIGEHLFQAGSDDELALLIVRGRYVLPTTLSAASVELLERMMECDPQRRLPMRAVKAHPWLADPPAQPKSWLSAGECT